MDEVRRFVRWTVPGTIGTMWAVSLSTFPTLIENVGVTSTPLPYLQNLTMAEAAFIAVFGLVVGVIVDALTQVLPTLVLRTGIVRYDMPGDVLRLAEVFPWATSLNASFPLVDSLVATRQPLRRKADPAIGRFLVWRLQAPTGEPFSAVTRDIRRQWRVQTETNDGLLRDVLATLTTDIGKDLNTKYLDLADRYRAMGSCRIAIALGGLVAVLRILAYRSPTGSIIQLAVETVMALGLTAAGWKLFSKKRADLLNQSRRVVVNRFGRAVAAELAATSKPDPATDSSD